MAPFELSPEEKAHYEREGYLVREAVFTPEEVELLRQGAEAVRRRASEAVAAGVHYRVDGNRYVDAVEATVQYEHRPGSTELRVVQPFHHLDRRLDRLIEDARLVEPMHGILGCDRIALFTDKLNLKPAREGSGFGWHQDSPYWAPEASHLDRLPNVMIALDDADRDNGCLRVIPGSHRRGLLPGRTGPGQLDGLFTDPTCFDVRREFAVEVPAGSAIFFAAHLVHGSEPNRSPRPRRAVVITYQPEGFPMFRRGTARPVRPRAPERLLAGPTPGGAGPGVSRSVQPPAGTDPPVRRTRSAALAKASRSSS